MSFFSKLKSRLTKSTSKLEQGLEDLVEEGDDESVSTYDTTNPLDQGGEEKKNSGFLGKVLGGSSAVASRRLDDQMLESLEELLIVSDMGYDTSIRISSNIAQSHMGRKLSTLQLKTILSKEITNILEPVAKPIPLFSATPQVILIAGVNGSGKTTTIGKLSSQFKEAGKDIVIAACDTFRAAAVQQLEIWGERVGVPVLKASANSDPAALAYQAYQLAKEDGKDLLIIDTAGRLQNRKDLMEELAKIVRVIKKIDSDAPHNTLLVLDATTGQNAMSQVEVFKKMVDISGLIMTKLDGTAKGGILVALASKFGLPIHAIGIGEGIDDLSPFDPEQFASVLTGLEGNPTPPVS